MFALTSDGARFEIHFFSVSHIVSLIHTHIGTFGTHIVGTYIYIYTNSVKKDKIWVRFSNGKRKHFVFSHIYIYIYNQTCDNIIKKSRLNTFKNMWNITTMYTLACDSPRTAHNGF